MKLKKLIIGFATLCSIALVVQCAEFFDFNEKGSDDGDIKNLFSATSGIPLSYEDPKPVLPKDGDIITDITNPKIMQSLEGQGFQLGQVFAQLEFGVGKPRKNNKDFMDNSPWYTSVVKDLRNRLDQHKAHYGGVHIEEADLTDRPRIFSKKWFDSQYADYELIAVVNRTDRIDMSHKDDKHVPTHCGEIRFIYRMAYDRTDLNPRVFSRLPFNFNMVFIVPRPENDDHSFASCISAASQFKVPHKMASEGEYLKWLKEGPLNLTRLQFLQLETNFQAVRITSGGKETLGGHAEYILTIHRPEGNLLKPYVLENTPDVEKIEKSPELKQNLIDFITSHLQDIDQGTVQFPQKFLAKHAVSFSTHGIHRLANRPFEKLLTTRDLAHIKDFSQTQFINHIDSLVARLDDLTCQGCHQANAIAGFHLVGRDRADRVHPLNAAWVGESPHFIEERRRRLSYNWMLAHKSSSPKEYGFRRLAFQKQKDTNPTIGDVCVRPEDVKKFFKGSHAKNLICDSKSKCIIFDRNRQFQPNLGTCMPKDDRPVAGLPCFRGDVIDKENQRHDTIANSQQYQCNSRGYRCFEPVKGTPGGMCYNRCDGTNERDSLETCAYNGGSAFDLCAASGNFASCIGGATSRGLRKACDAHTPCRDDFICQTFFSFGSSIKLAYNNRKQAGFCVPNYFLFQMRIDGHPSGSL